MERDDKEKISKYMDELDPASQPGLKDRVWDKIAGAPGPARRPSMFRAGAALAAGAAALLLIALWPQISPILPQRKAEEFYRLENVLFTQYFTDRGHALHLAWWKTPETIGRPGSHGCLNLLLEDAEYFWNWAGIGTPVYCHY